MKRFLDSHRLKYLLFDIIPEIFGPTVVKQLLWFI